MNGRYEYAIKGQPLLDTPFHYTLSGLPNIYLRNGVTFHDDDGYGPSYEITDIEGLHDMIAAHIIVRKQIMSTAEFKFLRKRMKKTQAEIASFLNISDQTVANYEKGKTDITGPVDISMRVLYLWHIMPATVRKELIDEIISRKDDSPSIEGIVPAHAIWREALAAA